MQQKYITQIIKNRIKQKKWTAFRWWLVCISTRYRKPLGTLLERRLDHNRDANIAFIDLEKTHNDIDLKKLFQIMKGIPLDWCDRCTILNLHKNQETIVDINGLYKRGQQRARIRKGIR